MIPPAEQLQIKLADPRHRRPMMTVDAAKGALDRNEDEVIQQIGVWLVAWNIANADAERRELRILSRSVSLAARHLNDNGEPALPAAPVKWDWKEILQFVLPSHDKPWFTGLEVQRVFNCGSTHVINLVESRVLELMPGTTYQRGRNGSPSIRRESFIRFLETRLEDARNVRGLK